MKNKELTLTNMTPVSEINILKPMAVSDTTTTLEEPYGFRALILNTEYTKQLLRV